MKKKLMAIIAVCGFTVGYGQTSASSTASVTTVLQDAIEILPPVNGGTFTGTWSSAFDYNSGRKWLGIDQWKINSTNTFHITGQLSPVTGPSGSIPLEKFSFALNSENTSFPPFGVSAYQDGIVTNLGELQHPPFGNTLATFQHGANSLLTVSLFAEPGWNNLAGTYTGILTLTATQP